MRVIGAVIAMTSLTPRQFLHAKAGWIQPFTLACLHEGPCDVINLLTLALTHGLIALAVINLLSRGELDDEDARPAGKRRNGAKRGNAGGQADAPAQEG